MLNQGHTLHWVISMVSNGELIQPTVTRFGENNGDFWGILEMVCSANSCQGYRFISHTVSSSTYCETIPYVERLRTTVVLLCSVMHTSKHAQCLYDSKVFVDDATSVVIKFTEEEQLFHQLSYMFNIHRTCTLDPKL